MNYSIRVLLFDNMKNTRISILGTGWLGLPLGLHLKELGYQVKGSTTSAKKIQEIVKNGLQPYLIQIDDRVVGENGEDFFDTDILIITIPPSREAERYQNTIRTIQKQILKNGIKKVLYTSSTSIYGSQGGLLTEKSPAMPKGVMSEGIHFAEQALTSDDFETTICRLAGLAGGSRNPAKFLAGSKNVKRGNALVNLVHQEDCIAIMTKIIENNHWNEIFNICSDIHPPRKVYYPLMAQLSNMSVPTFEIDENPSSAYKIVDNTKVKSVLAYEFLHPDPMLF